MKMTIFERRSNEECCLTNIKILDFKSSKIKFHKTAFDEFFESRGQIVDVVIYKEGAAGNFSGSIGVASLKLMKNKDIYADIVFTPTTNGRNLSLCAKTIYNTLNYEPKFKLHSNVWSASREHVEQVEIEGLVFLGWEEEDV